MVAVTGGEALDDDQWHQVVAVVDRSPNATAEEQVLLYVDGLLVDSGPLAFTIGDGRIDNRGDLIIGGKPVFFSDSIEESSSIAATFDHVTVFDRALLPEHVEALFANVDTPWHPATLSPSNAATGTSTLPDATDEVMAWRMQIPEGLEGQHQIDLRTTDAMGNQQVRTYAWRGVIDTRPPRLTLEARLTGVQYTDASGTIQHEIAYDYTAIDRHLDETTFSGPCDGASITTPDFMRSAAMEELFPDLTMRDTLRASCNRWEPTETPTATVRACDVYGNCAEHVGNLQSDRVQTSSVAAELPQALIIEPTDRGVVPVDDELSVTLVAESESPLREVAILLNETVAESITFTEAEAITHVQRTISIQVQEGTHSLAARATDWDGNVQQTLFPITVKVDGEGPAVTITTDRFTEAETYELGSGLMRLRGTVSDTMGIASVKVSVADGPFTDVTLDEDGTWRTTLYLGNAEGENVALTVQATDLSGRTSEMSKEILVDVPPPPGVRTTITNGPANLTRQTVAAFDFVGAMPGGQEVNSFRCRLDDGEFTECNSPQTYNGLAEGTHFFQVYAMADEDATPIPATYVWTIDEDI